MLKILQPWNSSVALLSPTCFTFYSLFPFKSLERYLPLQSNVSIEEPEHLAPPFLGGGLLQRLVLFMLSSLASHELHDPQELHAPFTM